MVKYITWYFFTGILLCGWTAFGQTQTKPNLVFLFADQLRADVLGCEGDKNAITPNIDKFAKTAVSFSNAVSVSPVCAPFRSSLLTGKYISSTGMVINEVNMNTNHKTIAHVLNEEGYNCGYVGKMHLNDRHTRNSPKGPERFGFDDYWAAYSFNHQSYRSYYFTDDANGDEIRVDLKGKYGPDVFTGLACDYIETASEKDQPFCLFLSWNPPHDPWVKENVPDHCYEKFKDKHFELPVNYKSDPDPYMDRYPKKFFQGDSLWQEGFKGNEAYQVMMRSYYAMVNSIDEQFGRILARIDKLGISENTIVVFTSDHGEMFGSQGRMYKLTFYDEAARIPLLIRYPEKIKPAKRETCINTPDLYPTLLGLMGMSESVPPEVEGKDLSFVLTNDKGEEPEYAFMQGMGHTYLWKDGYEWRAIRGKRYTYAKYLRDGAEFLYDRKKDPHMKNNVSAEKKYKDVLGELRIAMQNKMNELNDEFRPCKWYKDNWMYKDFSVKAAAQGEFGPLPPVEPIRKLR